MTLLIPSISKKSK